MTDAVQRLSASLADRYTIERELGAGGMATVYLAHDVRHDRKVALKVLRPELAAILGGERFLKEIRLTANLQHPHILPLHDSGEAEGIVYYVMPYVEGESLRDRLNHEKQLPVEDAVRIAREVADALDYAHRHHVVHRDIKPENILLHDGRALVADFGIALAVSSAGGGTRLTETGMSLGTPHYMAPEQAMGEREITPKADIYALGCVLYEMLTAEPPFTGATAQAIIARVMTEEPRSLTLQRRTIPPHVEAAVQKALEKLPADRFGSAAQFAEALGNRDYSVPVTRAAPGAADRGARRAADPARRWAPWAVAALAVVVAAFGWMRRSGAAAATDPVRFYHVPDSGHSATSACCGPPLAISPDGRTLAYEGQIQRIQVWVRALRELAARPLAGTEGARNLFFSPDGQWVGYSSSGNLMKVPVAGGAPVTIAEIGSQLLGATWTADNHIVFARLDSTGLFRVTADGGTPERLTRPDTTAGESGHVWPHYVPETNALLFTVWPKTGALGAAHVGLMRLGRRDVRIVSPGSMPQYAAGHLVTLRDGGVVVAQRFDPSSGDTSGPLVRLADGIITRAAGLGEFGLSRTGTLVYQLGNVGSVVALMGEGGAETRVPLALPQVSHFDNPRFSPDGRRVVLAGFHDVESRHVGYIIDLERGTSLRLTFGGNTEFLEWTPDGQRVVYRKGDTLATSRGDRSGAEEVVLAPGGRTLVGRIAVGAGWVAFSTTGGGGSDLWALPVDAPDSARAYLVTPFNEGAPALSPDGRWIAYVSNETGRDEVYVSSFPQPGPRATVSIDGGAEPQWGRDGRTLYFRNEPGELVAARLRQEPSGYSVESRRVLLRGVFERSTGGAEYDVHPRGGRFVTLATSGGGGRLVITLNAVQ